MPISHSTLLNEILEKEKVRTTRPYSDYWMKRTIGSKNSHYWKLRVPEDKKEHHFLGNSVLVEDPKRMTFGQHPEEEKLTTSLDIPNEEYAEEEGFDDFDQAVDWFIEEYGYERFLSMDYVTLRWVWIEGDGFEDIDGRTVVDMTEELLDRKKITVEELEGYA